MSETWTERFEVGPRDAGVDGALSVPGLCGYFQDAAGAHARAAAISIEDLGRDNLTWVLGRLQVAIGELPAPGRAVEVTTWPSRLRSFFVIRDFLAESAAAGGQRTVLARATSTWFVLDVARRRAVRIPERVRRISIPERERALEETFSKLPAPTAEDRSASFEVGRRDLDVNVHVNHLRYLDWALRTLDPDFRRRLRPRSLEIDFLAELYLGDTVRTVAQELAAEDGGGVTVLVSLQSEREGVEAARMRSRWRPANASRTVARTARLPPSA